MKQNEASSSNPPDVEISTVFLGDTATRLTEEMDRVQANARDALALAVELRNWFDEPFDGIEVDFFQRFDARLAELKERMG